MSMMFAISLEAGVGEKKTPVLLVRGIDSSDRFLKHLEKAIRDGGFEDVRYASYGPRFGWASLRQIGSEINEAARKLKNDTGAEKIDVVAYSMGALASRYFIQRLKGKEIVRKFISISGPHEGTYMGYFRAFQQGVRDMLPGSSFLDDLNSDRDPFGDIQVFSYYTPYDVIIVPASSSILKGSAEVRKFDVAMHHQMVKDPHVLKAVVQDLKKPHVAPSMIAQTPTSPAQIGGLTETPAS